MVFVFQLLPLAFEMFTNHRANPAGPLRLLFYCLLVNSCVHCNVPKPSAPAYLNQTIVHRSANDTIVDQFKSKSPPRKTFKGLLLADPTVDSSSIDSSQIEPVSPTLAAKSVDAARSPLAKPLVQPKPKSTSLIEASTSLSVLAPDSTPVKAAEPVASIHDERLPKAEARVQQPQHTRSRTGSTTIDLSEKQFGKPRIQYLNQSRPSTATYVTKNNEVLTVRTAVSKQGNKVTDLHIGKSEIHLSLSL